MLIVSKIERAKGTVITLDGTRYHFQPTAKIPQHVAEVENTDHIQTLLSIREGFAPFSAEEARTVMTTDAPTATPAPTPVQEPTPEQRLEANVEPQGNAPQEPTQQEGEQGAQTPDDGLEDMDDLTLEHAYHDALGKKPNANMKRETMIARIRSANAG